MSAPASITEEKATLLIVYDEIDARTRLCGIFEEEGYSVLTVSDASSALRILHKEHCDLVVLDLEIRGVEGLALCRLLRAQRATSKLWAGGESNLVVDDQVNSATNAVAADVAHAQTFSDKTLTSECCIAVDQ